MMHNEPPLHIESPSDPHAFDNIPDQPRPEFANHRCPVCHGHGEWNHDLYAGGRAIVKMCPTCHGFGWMGPYGETMRLDIIHVNGYPEWVEIINGPIAS